MILRFLRLFSAFTDLEESLRMRGMRLEQSIQDADRYRQAVPQRRDPSRLARGEIQTKLRGTMSQVIGQQRPQQAARRVAQPRRRGPAGPQGGVPGGQFRAGVRVVQDGLDQRFQDWAGEPIQALSGGSTSPFMTSVSGPIRAPSPMWVS